jgi:translocation and assembly module TamA
MLKFVYACGLAVWVALFALPAHAAEPGFVYDIDLNAPLTQRSMMEAHLDLYRWRDNERMDENQLRRLVALAPAQIGEFLATLGYYDPQIDVALESVDGGTWRVRIDIVPGEVVRVRGIDLRLNGPLADGSLESQQRLKVIQAGWSLGEGAVFRHEDWEAAKRNALKSLLLEAYPAATVTESQAVVDPASHTVNLQVVLDSGRAFTFGALDVKGLKRYPMSIVERLNPIRPGDPYSQARLLELQSRLQDSAYFSGATVTVDADAARNSLVPVQVEVTENLSRKLGFGIGISTDVGARGQVDYKDLNFLDRAWRLSSALKLDSGSQSLGAELQLPLTADGYRDSATALMERADIQGEVTRKLVLGGKRSIIKGKNESSYGVRYFLEQQEVAGVRNEPATALVPNYSWTRRDVDNVIYPTQGYLLTLQADVAAKSLLSDRDFLRGYGRVVYFYPLGKRDQLVLRGELGAVAAAGRDGIPTDFLFRTGGDQTVRGYAYQSLGISEGSAIVGGRYLAVASAEYVHWFVPQWGAAAFVDKGNAADSLGDLKPVLGYGVGARWKSPVGPLNLDIAYGDKTQALRLHFSVGFSF